MNVQLYTKVCTECVRTTQCILFAVIGTLGAGFARLERGLPVVLARKVVTHVRIRVPLPSTVSVTATDSTCRILHNLKLNGEL